MNRLTMLLATAGLVLVAVPATSAPPTDAAATAALAELTSEERAKTLEFERSLRPQQGIVRVYGGNASLNLGDKYYFLPAEDAKRVLTEAWGNPPEAANDVLGMVFPKGRHFYDGTWGAVLTYEDTGHVDDEDAASQDYQAVLDEMKSGEEAENAARKEAGYGGVHLVGWAQQPTYDATGKTLIWARNIKFDGEQANALNYDVRKLGRTGVLSMNMVSSMDDLPNVRAAAAGLSGTVEFDKGMAYADFDPSSDKVAEYGLAGLVAAGAGVAVAKKAGILGLLLLFLKKGFVVVLAAAAGLWAFLKRKLGWSKDEADEEYQWDAAGEEPVEAEPSEPPAPSETAPTDPR